MAPYVAGSRIRRHLTGGIDIVKPRAGNMYNMDIINGMLSL